MSAKRPLLQIWGKGTLDLLNAFQRLTADICLQRHQCGEVKGKNQSKVKSPRMFIEQCRKVNLKLN